MSFILQYKQCWTTWLYTLNRKM